MKQIIIISFFFFFQITLFAQSSNSLEKNEYLLDGKSFSYQYQSGAAIDISFSDGKLTYKWIAGRNAGNPSKTYPYKSRKLDDKVYLVNWHEPKLKNYITLVYDFNNNICASSVIVKYGSEKPILAFEGGIIENVKEK